MVLIGDLNRQMQLVEKTSVPDGLGGFTSTEILSSPIFVNITEQGDNEVVSDTGRFNAQTIEIIARRPISFLLSQELEYDNRRYRISSASNLDEFYVKIKAFEVDN